MSATNSTPIINLPLFIGTDKPAWLTDWNGAMNTIDTAIANLQTAEAGTATSLASLAQSVEALSGTVSQHTTAIQTVSTATAGNTGSINTINSLIGNGEPTTEDKTIIGAINEIYAEIGGGDGVEASDVVYSNTSSGLTATDVQNAIDEVASSIDVVDQSVGATYTFGFSTVATQLSANAGFYAPVTLPFTAKNTNYTVSYDITVIGGVPNSNVTGQTTAQTKNKNSVLLGLFDQNKASDVGYTSYCNGTLTITFAAD